MINQGDIDQQSLAGAISTGTHGTGIDLPCLSAFVQGFESLTADGELLQCDEQQSTEIFQAGRVTLGGFGILTNIDQWKHQHRHIEFWAFLHADQVMLKTLDETDDRIQPRK